MQHASTKTSESYVQLKGSLVPMTVMELFHYDQQQIESSLVQIISQAPGFFEDTPVIIALEKFQDTEASIDFESLLSTCELLRIKPVAVRGGSSLQQLSARKSGLAILPSSKGRKESKDPTTTAPTTTAPTTTAPTTTVVELSESVAPPTHRVDTISEQLSGIVENTTQATLAEQQPSSGVSPLSDHADSGNSTAGLAEAVSTLPAETIPTKIIYQPVRSGQQVYAKGGDLIILAAVSPGAEILADGNIHVYGPLRGRALAGVRGDTTARIFCQSLEAELVSIAGQYKISEDLQKSGWKSSSQVCLIDDKLTVTPLLK